MFVHDILSKYLSLCDAIISIMYAVLLQIQKSDILLR